MNRNILGRSIAALASIAAIGATAGCSTPGGFKPKCVTEAHLVDTTGSTAGFRGEWPAELTKSAYDTLGRGDLFVASTFTSGAGTVEWSVKDDGCLTPEKRPNRHRQWAASHATRLGQGLTNLTRSKTHGGSDPLAALEATSTLPKLRVVRIWSDLVIQDDGVDLSHRVSKARLDKLADAWVPRLSHLRGVHVVALHAGRGVDSDVAIRQSEDLMRTVLTRAGATFELQPVLGDTSA
jgi:hypothetical protein